MVEPLCIAIAGTPGTGKTTVCQTLSADFTILSLKDLAEEFGLLEPVDTIDGAAPVDIHRLADEWEFGGDKPTIIDGHLAHFLDVDGIVLLRSHPDVLRSRLLARGYDEAKITANIEWEMVSGTWSELLEFEIELPLLELDTSKQSPEQTAETIRSWVEGGLESKSIETQRSAAISWLESV